MNDNAVETHIFDDHVVCVFANEDEAYRHAQIAHQNGFDPVEHVIANDKSVRIDTRPYERFCGAGEQYIDLLKLFAIWNCKFKFINKSSQ